MLIEILLKSDEHAADFFRATKVGERVGDGVVILQLQQGCEFLLIELFDSFGDVVTENEVEELLLPVIEVGGDFDARPGCAFHPREGLECSPSSAVTR